MKLAQIVCQEERCKLGKGEFGYCFCSSYTACAEFLAWKDADKRKEMYLTRGKEDLDMWKNIQWERMSS